MKFPGKWQPGNFPGNCPGNPQNFLASPSAFRGKFHGGFPGWHVPGVQISRKSIPRGIPRCISRGIKFRQSPFPGKFPGGRNIRPIRGMALPIDFRRWRLFGCRRPPICGLSPKRRIFVSPGAAPDGGQATATIRRMRHLKSDSHLWECGRLESAFPENKGWIIRCGD